MPLRFASLLNRLPKRLRFALYRYRYLAVFTLIGLTAILAELAVVRVLPVDWPFRARALLGFSLSLPLSFVLNAWLNFRVPNAYLLQTFVRYSVVSVASFVLNLAAVEFLQERTGLDYSTSRLITSGCLFLLAYTAHRMWTFDRAKNFGIAVYLVDSESVASIRERIGEMPDHIHADLIDRTMNPTAADVNLERLAEIRKTWPGLPVAVHLMSRTPRAWLEGVLPCADWLLFHLNIDDDLTHLIARCREAGRKPGVVWHQSDPLEGLFPYLAHVDFVMILGIAEPGRSGQPISPRALQVAEVLDGLRDRYGFDLMFDGCVNPETIRQIPARYIVAASAVLRSVDPVTTICNLKTGGKYDRRAA